MQYAESGAIEAITEGMAQKGEEGSHE